MKYTLDADVVIAALDGSDVHHSRSRALFATLQQQGDPRQISAINLSEVLVAPAANNQQLRAARAAIAALGVTIHQPNEAIAVDAARLRHRHPISLPDAYLIATARNTAAGIASFDQRITRAAAIEQVSVATI